MGMTELHRINTNINGERPAGSFVLFSVKCASPAEALTKIKAIAEVLTAMNADSWPTEEEWARRLPRWFVSAIKSNTIEMIHSNPILWDYGSWLDALRMRQWEWFSSQLFANGFEIVCAINGVPYSINTLEYIIYESGGNSDTIQFIESL